MAKQAGLGMRLLVGGYDISGDIQAIDTISGGQALIDVTDITQSAHARIGGLRDGSLAFTAYMDAADAHPVLSALPTADVLMSALINPLAVGSPAACLNAKQVGYDPSRGSDGSLTLKVAGEGNSYGLEWCEQLTAGLRTDTTGTAGAAQDDGAATSYGGQAYLQVTAFTGTSVTVTVEHSADNVSWSSLAAFTAVTAAPATQRIVVSNTAAVDRYLRATTSGTFTSATFAVMFDRNRVAGVAF